jgi:hypothetical protein
MNERRSKGSSGEQLSHGAANYTGRYGQDASNRKQSLPDREMEGVYVDNFGALADLAADSDAEVSSTDKNQRSKLDDGIACLVSFLY